MDRTEVNHRTGFSEKSQRKMKANGTGDVPSTLIPDASLVFARLYLIARRAPAQLSSECQRVLRSRPRRELARRRQCLRPPHLALLRCLELLCLAACNISRPKE